MPKPASPAPRLTAPQLDHLVTVDLNSAQIQGFFHAVPCTNLPSTPVFRKYLQAQILKKELPNVEELVVVALGPANVGRAKALGDMLGVWKCVNIVTRRISPEPSTVGEVGKHPEKVLQLDDGSKSQVKGLSLSLSLSLEP